MRVVQLVIYGFWGICLFVAAMGKFGDFFTAGTGFWSVVMLFVAGLCQLLASIASIVWAFYGTGNLRAKYLPYKFVNNYTVPVLVIMLALMANAARSSSDEARAHKLGFKDGKEFTIARENNISNVIDYAKFAEEQRIKVAEKDEQDKISKMVAEYAVIFSDSDEKVPELIKKDLKENPELTQQILKEITSYTDSVDRTVSKLDYIKYGVSHRQYMSAIEHSDCRINYSNSMFSIDEYYKTQRKMREEMYINTNWDMMPPIERKKFLYDGERLTLAYLKEQAPIKEKFNACVFNLLKTIPQLSRPNARPNIVSEVIPAKIKCVRENGGNVDMCY